MGFRFFNERKEEKLKKAAKCYSIGYKLKGRMEMADMIKKQFKQLEKKEQKLMQKKQQRTPLSAFTEKIEEKIPDNLQEKLELAFYKGFQIVFEKGSGIIEKTYDQEQLQKEHALYDYGISQLKHKKSLKKLNQQVNKGQWKNLGLTTLEGTGLGLLGIGLPDIPLFIGVLLRGIYEVAMQYGYDYNTPEEKNYILTLIEAAMSPEEEKQHLNLSVDAFAEAVDENYTLDFKLEAQMKRTASTLATDMLCMKFIQGLPIVGVVGGMTNMIYYKKILDYAKLKYQKRYLLKKTREE